MDDRKEIEAIANEEYRYGFTSDIQSDTIEPGLNEDVVRFISSRKSEPDWLLEYRLEALKRWRALPDPDWARLDIDLSNMMKFPTIQHQNLWPISPSL